MKKICTMIDEDIIGFLKTQKKGKESYSDVLRKVLKEKIKGGKKNV